MSRFLPTRFSPSLLPYGLQVAAELSRALGSWPCFGAIEVIIVSLSVGTYPDWVRTLTFSTLVGFALLLLFMDRQVQEEHLLYTQEDQVRAEEKIDEELRMIHTLLVEHAEVFTDLSEVKQSLSHLSDQVAQAERLRHTRASYTRRKEVPLPSVSEAFSQEERNNTIQ